MNRVSEGKAISLCQECPQVVSFIEEFHLQDTQYIVTKFVNGGDLTSYLQAHNSMKLPEEQARRIFVGIALGLKGIHAMGIVHRDIKHMNILLSNRSAAPKVKITDFGLAAKIGEKYLSNTAVGTCGFMAPEVVQGEPSDYKADIWSLGAILYALICGEVPFAAETHEATLENTITAPLLLDTEVWQETSAECKELLLSMMEKD